MRNVLFKYIQFHLDSSRSVLHFNIMLAQLTFLLRLNTLFLAFHFLFDTVAVIGFNTSYRRKWGSKSFAW